MNRYPHAGYLLVLAALLLGACAGVQREDEETGVAWPEGAPPRDYFEAQYAADSANEALQTRGDYLMWVSRFYGGMNPVPGWLEARERVLARVEPDARDEVARTLRGLGRKISAEWAKDNSVRLLDTRMVNVWRDALMEAVRQDDIRGFLRRLEADVDALLAGTLDGDEIYFGRYYEDDFDSF